MRSSNGDPIVDSVERLMARGRLDQADLAMIENGGETARRPDDVAAVREWRDRHAVSGATSLVSAAKC